MRTRYLVAVALFLATAGWFAGCNPPTASSRQEPERKRTDVSIDTPGASIDVHSKEGSGTNVDVKRKDKSGG